MTTKYRFIPHLLFLLAVVLMAYIFIDPTLMFQLQQLGFSSDPYLFKEYLGYPGGKTEYFSIFLFQFTTMRFAGSLVLGILLLLIAEFAGLLLKPKKENAHIILAFAPSLILAALVSNYAYPLIYVVDILLILTALVIFKYLLRIKANVGITAFGSVILLPLAYYILGGFSFGIFVFSALLYLLVGDQKNKIQNSFLLIVISAFIPLIASNFIFFITTKDAYFRLQPYVTDYSVSTLDYVLFLSIPAIVLLQKVMTFFPKRLKAVPSIRIVQYTFVIVVFVAIVALTLDRNLKNKLEIDKLAFNDEWEQVLEEAKNNPTNDRLISFHANRALYETGKMSTNLFDYQQYWGVDGLFLIRHFMNEILLPSTQLFLDMGYVNEAIHWGNEAVSQFEYSPQIIEQLIVANIIANKYPAAQVYINQLKEFTFFKRKAMEYEVMITSGNIAPELLAIRKLQPINNFVVSRLKPNYDLENILDDRPNNKMAYEYLMSYFLLENNLADFYKYYDRGLHFYGGKIPRLYQEALTSYLYELNMKGMPVPDIKIDDEVLADFTDYLMILSDLKDDLEVSRPFLEKKFKNTYWFYLNYTSPVTYNRKVVVE